MANCTSCAALTALGTLLLASAIYDNAAVYPNRDTIKGQQGVINDLAGDVTSLAKEASNNANAAKAAYDKATVALEDEKKRVGEALKQCGKP